MKKKKLLSFLSRNGATEYKEMHEKFSQGIIGQCFLAGAIRKIIFSAESGHGSSKYRTNSNCGIFKKAFAGKIFYADSTHLVRLCFDALILPNSQGGKCALTHFLHRYCTRAKVMAIKAKLMKVKLRE